MGSQLNLLHETKKGVMKKN